MDFPLSLIWLFFNLKAMPKSHIMIGTMIGRLSNQIDDQIQAFPTNSWKTEFKKAQICGFDSIEWVFDLNPNPILQNDGLDEMHFLSKKHDVEVMALCADYFMVKKLFNVEQSELEQNIGMLKKLIEQCSKLGIEIIEIPFVDTSSLKTQADEDQIVTNLQKITEFATSQNVKITLETDLAPQHFKNLLTKFGSDVGANYDTGNSAALGYDPREELQTLKPWLTNIHIKDRLYAGNTVPLGTGSVNFDLIFSNLAKINYNGQLIIQGARQDKQMIAPEDTCKNYLSFVKSLANKYNLVTLEHKVNHL